MAESYCTVAQLKARLDQTTDQPELDAVLDDVIEAASRAIDGFCNRRFYRATETRHYTADDSGVLDVDDLASVTTLKTDDVGNRTYSTTWLTTDYDLEPYNAALNGAAYTQIRLTPNGTHSFPSVRRGVEIAGSWGYSATAPHAIREACLIQATRLVKRPTAPFGTESSPDIGVFQPLSRLDPDVQTLCAPFRRMTVGAV